MLGEDHHRTAACELRVAAALVGSCAAAGDMEGMKAAQARLEAAQRKLKQVT